MFLADILKERDDKGDMEAEVTIILNCVLKK
jgi:hypothetical protein